ncbi:MAG: putative RNA uridine N3 methyltransferase [Candidatus Caldarchaeales archaeon]
MIVEKRGQRIDVLIPSSFSSETDNPIEKILKIGLVARFLAACRVETLIIYHEEPENPLVKEARYIKLIMDYLNTAPYLRKKIFPLTSKLKYVGVLPPLNIPTHPEKPNLDIEHYREGLVISSNKDSVIEAGLDRKISVSRKLRVGSRVIVRVQPAPNKTRFKIYSKRKSRIYSGFKTAIVSEKINEIVKDYDLKIATSRMGVDIRNVLDELKERLKNARKICIAFGAAKRGLYEIAEIHKINLEKTFDYVLNTFPDQGLRTIRTEEALAYTLAIINLISS